jgi:hypothetical protein
MKKKRREREKEMIKRTTAAKMGFAARDVFRQTNSQSHYVILFVTFK